MQGPAFEMEIGRNLILARPRGNVHGRSEIDSQHEKILVDGTPCNFTCQIEIVDEWAQGSHREGELVVA
jgi:hypothetical protein